ncbi:MAG: serine/threonine protein kinase, partial [Butyrivibrio sp.]|nr:serine/threonine protein kinase [Butyrivibrio sp.]
AIIYRDLKPSNIMLRPNGTITLIDFGTAREYKEENTGDTSYLGTRDYAAPEQFGGMGQTDARTDL